MACGERWNPVVSFGLLAYDFDSRCALACTSARWPFMRDSASALLGGSGPDGHWRLVLRRVLRGAQDRRRELLPPCCWRGSRTGEGCCSSDPWFLDGLKAHDEGCCSWAAEGLLGRVWNAAGKATASGIHVKTQQAATASAAALVLDYQSDLLAASAAKATGYMVLQCEVRVLEAAATAAAIWEGASRVFGAG